MANDSLWRRLDEPSEDHSVEAAEVGFVIRRRDGRADAFDRLARKLIDTAHGVLALPTTDGRGGYESVHIIPL